MKILYALQATGNGHISRAMEIIPYLNHYGEVDIFLSGSNSSLEMHTPVRFRSKGLSLFYNCRGSLNYVKTALAYAPYRLWKESRDLPVERYDLVLNDFEHITARACHLKKVPSIGFGHQASFFSPQTPRPEKISKTGEWILKNYAPATCYIGLHFENYDRFILPPVVREVIRNASPQDKGHITVYLPSYCEAQLQEIFNQLPRQLFHIYSGESPSEHKRKNILFKPVSRQGFSDSLINCHGLITGAGFETPAEALYLGKKLMVIPIKGQYEQTCNAAALEKMGVCRLPGIGKDFPEQFQNWVNKACPARAEYPPVEQIIDKVMKLTGSLLRSDKRKAPENLSFFSTV